MFRFVSTTPDLRKKEAWQIFRHQHVSMHIKMHIKITYIKMHMKITYIKMRKDF